MMEETKRENENEKKKGKIQTVIITEKLNYRKSQEKKRSLNIAQKKKSRLKETRYIRIFVKQNLLPLFSFKYDPSFLFLPFFSRGRRKNTELT